jgi:uncharacterized protein with HEPN domain
VKDGRETLFIEKMRQDALIRKLEIVGQAVKNLSDDAKQRQPDIPWKRIAGMRDRLTHDYFGVDLALVWVAIQQELPKLKEAVEQLLADAKGRTP